MASRLKQYAALGILMTGSSLAQAGVGLDYSGGGDASGDQPYNFSVSTTSPAMMGQVTSEWSGGAGGGPSSHRDRHMMMSGGSSMQAMSFRTGFGGGNRSRGGAGAPGGSGAAGAGGSSVAGRPSRNGAAATPVIGNIGMTDPDAPVNSDTNLDVDPRVAPTGDTGAPSDAGGLNPSVVPEPTALAIWSVAGIALIAATRRVTRTDE